MKYGWMSGFLWALDTVLLGVVLSQILPEEDGWKIFWVFPVIPKLSSRGTDLELKKGKFS